MWVQRGDLNGTLGDTEDPGANRRSNKAGTETSFIKHNADPNMSIMEGNGASYLGILWTTFSHLKHSVKIKSIS